MNLCFTVSLKWSFLIHLISFSLRLSLSYLAILILLIDVLLQTFAYYFLPISFLTELVFSCYYLSFFSISLPRYPSFLIPPQLQLHIWFYAPSGLRIFARNSFNGSHFNDMVKMSARFTSDGTCDRQTKASSSWWRIQARRYPVCIEFLVDSTAAISSSSRDNAHILSCSVLPGDIHLWIIFVRIHPPRIASSAQLLSWAIWSTEPSYREDLPLLSRKFFIFIKLVSH